jgi:hypothetical protein
MILIMSGEIRNNLPRIARGAGLAIVFSLSGYTAAKANSNQPETTSPTLTQPHHRVLDGTAEDGMADLDMDVMKLAKKRSPSITTTKYTQGNQTRVEVTVVDKGSITAPPQGEIFVVDGPRDSNDVDGMPNPGRVSDLQEETYVDEPLVDTASGVTEKVPVVQSTINYTVDKYAGGVYYQQFAKDPGQPFDYEVDAYTEPTPGAGQSFLNENRLESALNLSDRVAYKALARTAFSEVGLAFTTPHVQRIPQRPVGVGPVGAVSTTRSTLS